MKSGNRLDREIAQYLDSPDIKRRGGAKNARLVVLNDDGEAIDKASPEDLRTYASGKPLRGRRDYTIGIRFHEGENDVAISLEPAELKAMLR